MAKKLQDLMLKNDDNGKQLRCLIVEDYKTGSVRKIRDRDKFESILKEVDEMFITKIYEPTAEQRNELLNTLQAHKDEAGEVVEVPENVVLFTMLQFTDLELDSSVFEENEELLEQVLSNPNPLFMAIKNELDLMFIESIAMLIDITDSYRQLPDEWLDLSNQLGEVKTKIKQQEKKKKKYKKEIKSLKEKVELTESDLIDTIQ